MRSRNALLFGLVFAAVFAGSVCSVSGLSAGDYATLKVGSFNIQVFGTSKAAKADVMSILVRIIQRFDVMAVQEIRDASNTAFPTLINQLNANVTGIKTYAYVIGSRMGPTSSKEQYAFIYDTAKLQPVGSFYEYPINGQFARPPLAVQFRVKAFNAATNALFPPFVLVDIHTTPDDAVAEIDALADVYDAVNANFSNPNILTVGDYNCGCSYVSNSAYANIRFFTQTRFKWYIPNTADTMVSSACPYDRIVAGGSALQAVVNASSAGPFDYEAAWRVNHDVALDVSDHLPVSVWLQVPYSAANDTAGTGGNGEISAATTTTRAQVTGTLAVAMLAVAAFVARFAA